MDHSYLKAYFGHLADPGPVRILSDAVLVRRPSCELSVRFPNLRIDFRISSSENESQAACWIIMCIAYMLSHKQKKSSSLNVLEVP